jgi:hypothetical protein
MAARAGGHVEMSWLRPIPDAIPTELRALPWVVWRSKIPYRVRDPRRRASSTDPTTWASFDEAVGLASRPTMPVDGIGVVLTLEAGVTCLDLDHVIEVDGSLDRRAQTIVERCHSWTEISPSGSGVHVFVRGRVPHALKGEHLEIYSTARFICVTGHHWLGTPDALADGQAYLDWLIARAHDRDLPRRPFTGPRAPPPDDLAGALLARLDRWGVAVERLKPFRDGYLVEVLCPWAAEHTTGPGGAAVMIFGSGAHDFTCPHAHCAGRRWREFRSVMESRA